MMVGSKKANQLVVVDGVVVDDDDEDGLDVIGFVPFEVVGPVSTGLV